VSFNINSIQSLRLRGNFVIFFLRGGRRHPTNTSDDFKIMFQSTRLSKIAIVYKDKVTNF